MKSKVEELEEQLPIGYSIIETDTLREIVEYFRMYTHDSKITKTRK